MDSCCRLELKQEMSEIPMLLPLFMTTQLLDMCLAKFQEQRSTFFSMVDGCDLYSAKIGTFGA